MGPPIPVLQAVLLEAVLLEAVLLGDVPRDIFRNTFVAQRLPQLHVRNDFTVGTATTFMNLNDSLDSAAARQLPFDPLDPDAAGGAVLLVVDDEPVVRRVVRHVLEPDRWTVAEADDGLDALVYIQSGQLPVPDIVLSDLVMPGLSGHIVIEMLAEFRPELPVVAMTGYAPDPEQQFHWGCLHKPFNPDELRIAIRQVLAKSRQLRAQGTATRAEGAVLRAKSDAGLARARELYERSSDLVAAALELQRARNAGRGGPG